MKSAMTVVDGGTHHEASGIRHTVPEDLRRRALSLKATVDRSVGLLGRHWVADEQVAGLADMFADIARQALELRADHIAFARGLKGDDDR
jgi:hypothetical protein